MDNNMYKKPFYVICKNHSEFLDYYTKTSDEDKRKYEYLSVSHHSQLASAMNPHGCFYGKWKENTGINDILIKLSMCYENEPIPQIIPKIYDELKTQ
jgi:hypothetical protein